MNVDWSSLDEPLWQEPRFFIEPRDAHPATEIERVVAFRRALRMRLPAARVVAIPNAGSRGQKAVNQAKAEGAVWGFPDLIVLHAGRIAFLEFKNGKRAPEDHQVDQLNWLTDAGYDVACVRSADGALVQLDEWGWFE